LYLIWVFAAMLLFAVVEIFATLPMPDKRAGHAVSRAEALEAMAQAARLN